MLVSIAVNAASFGPSSITDIGIRDAAEDVLTAATENAVLLTIAGEKFVRDVGHQILQLPTKLGQQLGIRVPDLQSCSARSLVTAAPSQVCEVSDPVARLRYLATALHADLVLCSTSGEVDSLTDLRNQGIEVCTVGEFRNCETEVRRKKWTHTQRLDNIHDDATCKDIVGRTVKYGRKIVIADRMFGRQARDGASTKNLRLFARGVVYLAERWQQQSPYSAGQSASVEIITEGGQTSGGFVNPKTARLAIEDAIRVEDRQNVVGNIVVCFKRDSQPEIFLERYIGAGNRCWCIKHGIDFIGGLFERPKHRKATFIDPDCDANRQVLAQIRDLRDAPDLDIPYSAS